MYDCQPIKYEAEDCYQLLIGLKSELEGNLYQQDEIIQVMRIKKALYDDYHPIFFYYPSHDKMLQEFSKPDDPSVADVLPTNSEFLKQYESERKYLSPIKVIDALFELEETYQILKG